MKGRQSRKPQDHQGAPELGLGITPRLIAQPQGEAETCQHDRHDTVIQRGGFLPVRAQQAPKDRPGDKQGAARNAKAQP